jgi:hypothetical protein
VQQAKYDVELIHCITQKINSIIDKASGDTRPEDVRKLLKMTKKLVK